MSSTAKPSRRNSGFQTSCGARGLDQRGEAGGRAGRHGRLPDDHATLTERHASSDCDSGVDVGQVGGELALLLRRADADEVHVAELADLLVGRREAQSTGRQGAHQQLRQARLEERNIAGVEPVDLPLSTSRPSTSWPSSAIAAACVAPR